MSAEASNKAESSSSGSQEEVEPGQAASDQPEDQIVTSGGTEQNDEDDEPQQVSDLAPDPRSIPPTHSDFKVLPRCLNLCLAVSNSH